MPHSSPLSKQGQTKMEEIYTGKQIKSDIEQISITDLLLCNMFLVLRRQGASENKADSHSFSRIKRAKLVNVAVRCGERSLTFSCLSLCELWLGITRLFQFKKKLS